jgi:hypothetical protein
VLVDNAPGNQVFWIYGPTLAETASTATVRNCRIYRVANDIPGNYNGDHSSSYIQAHYIYQYKNSFIKTIGGTTETAMELHGIYNYCIDNVVINYDRPAHIVADMGTDIQIVKIDGNRFTTRLMLLFWTNHSALEGMNDISITNNEFIGQDSTNAMPGIDLVSYTTSGVVKKVSVLGNTFRGNTWLKESGAINFGTSVRAAFIANNLFDTLAWRAIYNSASTSLTEGDNRYVNCPKADPMRKITQ